MGQVLHGCARTTEATRRAIQNSQESIRVLATKYGVNPKTVAKWKNREGAKDSPMGPKEVKPTVLTKEGEAIIVAFHKHTLLPLDDCLYALRDTIHNLARPSLHRCLQRNGISRLPDMDGKEEPKKKFKKYTIGFFHIGITEARTDEGKLYLFVEIGRTSKFVVAKLFDRACKKNNIEHRLTKPTHPWANGQVERMNRTIKDATVNRYFYQNNKQLESHLDTFIAAYNYAKRLKALSGLTPYEFIIKTWGDTPGLFSSDPSQLNLGLYI